MKKNVLVLLTLLVSLGLYSQNWVPINTTEKFCYVTESVGLISHVLWVDSITSNTNPELLYLNKIAVPWETAGENTYINFQSEFLLDEVEIYASGEWYFSDTLYPVLTYESFSIFPYLGLGESWSFTNNITATITELAVLEVFGEQDSVKTISLSTGQDIIISKNYGIINWMDEYQLIGIEGRDLGVTVPTFDDMFSNISAGDVVCYSEGEWIADEQVTGWIKESRFDIIDITYYTDSVVIGAYVRSNTSYFWNKSNNKSNSSYQEIVFYPTDITEAYPNEAVYVASEYYQGMVINKLGTHKWGGQKKTQVTYENGDSWVSTLFHECDELYFYELCPAGDWDGDHVLLEYTPEYGFLEYYDAGFEWGGHKDIVGIIDHGDTLGTIYPINMFVGQEEINNQSNILIYPSPTKEKLYIKTTETGTANWSIFDIAGRLVQTGKDEKRAEDIVIQVGHFPKGVFILQVEINEQIIRKKFIKN